MEAVQINPGCTCKAPQERKCCLTDFMYRLKGKTPRLECLKIESKSTIRSSDVNDFRKATKHMPVGICFYKAPDECIDAIALYLPKKDRILEYPIPPCTTYYTS